MACDLSGLWPIFMIYYISFGNALNNAKAPMHKAEEKEKQNRAIEFVYQGACVRQAKLATHILCWPRPWPSDSLGCLGRFRNPACFVWKGGKTRKNEEKRKRHDDAANTETLRDENNSSTKVSRVFTESIYRALTFNLTRPN